MIREVATPEQAFTNGDKTTWLALVIFTGVIGFLAYRVYGRRQ
jgi:heme/copper-type cytochrome/quinol oxidase subunit 2